MTAGILPPDEARDTSRRLPLDPGTSGWHFFGQAGGAMRPTFWIADLQAFEGGAPGRGLKLATCEQFFGPYLGKADLVAREDPGPCRRDGCGTRLLCCRADCPLFTVGTEPGLRRIVARAGFVEASPDGLERAPGPHGKGAR